MLALPENTRISRGAIVVLVLAVLGSAAYWVQSRRATTVPTIALIPQSAGAMRWEAEHLGATAAAEMLKCHLYWNAPTSENDVAGQISLIDRAARGQYQGLIVAPNHPLAILAPLRRALAEGLPLVIVSTSLDLPAGDKIAYILNDDEKMGEMAAAEIARLIQGEGNIAVVGIGRHAPGVHLRIRGAERFLAEQFPDIRVVSRLGAAYNTSRAEELAGDVLDSDPRLKAILSFTSAATRGVHAAMKSRSLLKVIHLVGCEQDSDLLGYVDSGEIAAVLAENTYRMGYEAVELMAASWAGKPMPARSVIEPVLITKWNLHAAETNLLQGFPK